MEGGTQAVGWSQVEGAPRVLAADLDKLLEWLVCVAEMMGRTVGENHEFVVHDLRRQERSVMHVVNGHITNRQVGQGIRDLLGVLNAEEFSGGALINYQAPLVVKNREIRASTLVFFDESERPAAALCMNVDVTDLLRARDVLSAMAFPGGGGMHQVIPGGALADINSVLDMMIADAIEESGFAVDELSKDQKMDVVRALDVRGAFHVRHAHTRVAKALMLSRESVFRYLQQLREREPAD